MCEPGILKVAKTKPDSEIKIENAAEVVSLFLIHNIIPMKIYTAINNQNILTHVPIYLQQVSGNIFTNLSHNFHDIYYSISTLFAFLHSSLIRTPTSVNIKKTLFTSINIELKSFLIMLSRQINNTNKTVWII
jgi:hypothetical protein